MSRSRSDDTSRIVYLIYLIDVRATGWQVPANGTDFAPAWANGFSESQLYVNGLKCWLRWVFIQKSRVFRIRAKRPIRRIDVVENMAKAIWGRGLAYPIFFVTGGKAEEESRFQIPDSRFQI